MIGARKTDPSTWSVYVVTDYRLSGKKSHEFLAKEAFLGGADVVQLRDKDLSPRDLLATAKKIRDVAGSMGRALIVNDRIDIALASSAHGVHIGYDDFPYSPARSLCPKPFILGVSGGTMEELKEAIGAGVDYIGVGPVFETREAKPDAGPPVGLKFIEEARKVTEIPLIGIGGIDHENAPSVIRAGAAAVAVISAVVASEDIAGSVRRMKGIVEDAKSSL